MVRLGAFLAGVLKKVGVGDNPISHMDVNASNSQATDANSVITAVMIASGLYYRSGQTAGRTDTTDTGANLDTALPDLNVGDTFLLQVSNQAAQVLTIAGGVGVTIQSTKTTVIASGRGKLLFRKTGTATYDLYVL